MFVEPLYMDSYFENIRVIMSGNTNLNTTAAAGNVPETEIHIKVIK